MSLLKIQELFVVEKGILQSSKSTDGKFDFITASAIWKTHNEYTHDCEALIFAAAASGSLGRTHYVDGRFISSDLCFILTPKNPINFPVDLKFYHLIFNQLKDDIVKNTKAGTSKEAIGLKSFGNYKLPYFDIDKQVEIKNKFIELQSYSVDLDLELSSQLYVIKQLRQAFLSEAMQGKLCEPELFKDKETGQQFLERIKNEKVQLIRDKKSKKEKELPTIKQEEIPFEIPANWIWCRLGEVAYITSGSTPSKDAFVESGIPYLKMYNLRNQKIDFLFKPQYIKEEVHNGQLKRCRAFPGDVIMNIVGPPLGKIAVIPKDLGECNFNQAAVLIRPLYKEMNWFIFWYLNEMSAINSIDTKGVAGQANISVTQAQNIKLPLPPLSTQRKIVENLDKLLKTCDDLEASIKQSQLENKQLLQQVLKEALVSKAENAEIKTKYCNNPEKTILAGYIINKNNDEYFGRVKFQKLLHLTEYHCKIDLGSNFIQKVAGPHDEYLIKTIETDLKRFRFYQIKQSSTDNHKVSYIPLSSATELNQTFNINFKEEVIRVNSLLSKFERASLDHCEIISTLYAVWNNRLINKLSFTDEDLKQDFLDWDCQKAKYTDRLDNALIWMRKENIVPNGWGKYIGKPEK
ncbi:restriction endonuclease subunit S [Pedobacter sp. B4-66]|uniref:restriction endonuclease subunit S n=1 Tax=Pedobacter sp. B4-66 TaxID=2817280 RepID=UPI001BD9B5EE|nr:restriction endonuclease subunit S [Pedobacter sp. B4-66]